MDARLNRVVAQRLFVTNQVDLHDCERAIDLYACYEEGSHRAIERARDAVSHFRYDVLGSTGFLYHVRLAQDDITWTCSCPDWLRRRTPCKHILLIWLRVLRYSRYEVRYPQFPYYANFKNRCLARIASIDARVAAPHVEGSTARAMVSGEGSLTPSYVACRSVVGADCGICCETISSDDQVVHCETSCGNPIHSECFDMLRAAAAAAAPVRHRHLDPCVKCIFCRQTMRFPRMTGHTTPSIQGNQKKMRAMGFTYVSVDMRSSRPQSRPSGVVTPQRRSLIQTMGAIFGARTLV
jgi:hypothetical protein